MRGKLNKKNSTKELGFCDLELLTLKKIALNFVESQAKKRSLKKKF